eukprot:6191359-Pleurochrysis_carterae.AAC.7
MEQPPSRRGLRSWLLQAMILLSFHVLGSRPLMQPTCAGHPEYLLVKCSPASQEKAYALICMVWQARTVKAPSEPSVATQLVRTELISVRVLELCKWNPPPR